VREKFDIFERTKKNTQNGKKIHFLEFTPVFIENGNEKIAVLHTHLAHGENTNQKKALFSAPGLKKRRKRCTHLHLRGSPQQLPSSVGGCFVRLERS
jgi:hypothetical protein